MLQDIRETRLAQGCKQLAHSLALPGKARCMGCNTSAEPNQGWRVVGYMPDDPQHPPIAYLLCGPCYQSPEHRHRAILGVETMARDRATNPPVSK